MVKITYPQDLKCPSCNSIVGLDYSDKDYVKTDDLLVMTIRVPCSRLAAKDRRTNKQNLIL
jgi:hypothetical protein